MAPHPSRLAWLALALLAACGEPDERLLQPSQAALNAPPPQLAETARFAGPLAGAVPDAERLAAEREALAARAAALRTRAAGLSAPVLTPAEARRLSEPLPKPD